MKADDMKPTALQIAQAFPFFLSGPILLEFYFASFVKLARDMKGMTSTFLVHVFALS